MILNLLNLIFQGNQKKSIECLREMINEGIEPINFLNDLLELIYFMQQKKNIGNLDSDLSISESHAIEQNAIFIRLCVNFSFSIISIYFLEDILNPIVLLGLSF